MRRVHWPQTARHGELIVCEVESNASPRVQVILDTNRAAHVGVGANSSCEWAIRIAASLVEGWAGQGAEVEMVFNGGTTPERGMARKARLSALFDALARWEPHREGNVTTFADVFDSWRVEDRLRVVVTTDIGILASSVQGGKLAGTQFVVLRAEGFCQEMAGAAQASLAIVPWVLIEGPDDVVVSLRKLGREVVLEC